MKKELIAIFIIVLLVSCNKKKSVYITVNPKDTACIKELQIAEVDLKNNKIVYCNYTGSPGFHALRAEKQMDSLLKIKNIEFQNESSPCVIDEKLNYHCYCDLMQEKINEKFGNKFIDSLLFKADSIYILKHLNEIYYNGSLNGSWDKPALFPGDKYYDEMNHSGLQTEFERIVKYPKNYVYKTEENSMSDLSVNLIIDEKGKATIIDSYLNFWNSKTKKDNFNKEYCKYFKDIINSLIENTKWKPAQIKGINVKSKNHIIVYLK